MIGLKRGTVALQSHHAEWEVEFKNEKEKLKHVFEGVTLDIQHIGSTAIPGVSAKPIIDIGVFVNSFQDVETKIIDLEGLGYIQKKENRPERMFFAKGSDEQRTHYLHIGEKGSSYVEDMILFRDYLISHPEVAKEYSDLKQDLTIRFAEQREVYTSKKEAFVNQILTKAKL